MSDLDVVMTDHPAWVPAGEGHGELRVFVSDGGGRWLARTGGPAAVTVEPLAPAAVEPVRDVFSLPPDALPQLPQLARRLAGLGPVARFRTGNLWDAVGTAAVRQMLHGTPGATLYRRFCQAHGEGVRLPTGEWYWLFPTAEAVRDLSPNQFVAAGLAAKRGLLRHLATRYLKDGRAWQRLSPPRLTDELVRIPRVGEWTARAAVADWSNDWSLYPAGDLTLRRCVSRAVQGNPWPTHDQRAFANFWRLHTGTHLGRITVLTLAWGNRHLHQTQPSS